MVPMVSSLNEFKVQKQIIQETAEELFAESDRIEFEIGTMIETPRAALIANGIAEVADFFTCYQ